MSWGTRLRNDWGGIGHGRGMFKSIKRRVRKWQRLRRWQNRHPFSIPLRMRIIACDRKIGCIRRRIDRINKDWTI